MSIRKIEKDLICILDAIIRFIYLCILLWLGICTDILSLVNKYILRKRFNVINLHLKTITQMISIEIMGLL